MARPRKPDALKVSHRPSRINFKQPKPPPEYPAQPVGLSPIGRRLWPDICATLFKLGVLSNADGLAVEGLVESYAELVSAREQLAARGGAVTYQTPGGLWRAWPEVAIANDADRRFRMWLSAFGLSPSDRSRVTIVPPEAKDDFSDFLN